MESRSWLGGRVATNFYGRGSLVVDYTAWEIGCKANSQTVHYSTAYNRVVYFLIHCFLPIRPVNSGFPGKGLFQNEALPLMNNHVESA